VNAIGDVIESLRQVPGVATKDKSTDDIAVEYYEHVKWDLDQIRDVLMPRVVQSSNDQILIDALVELDDSRRELHNATIAHKKITVGGVVPNVVGLLDRARAVYSLLVDRWVLD
jgi:hypothetical protein